MRKVILHYHLFKNAGTSLDGLFEQNFGKAWISLEGTHAAARLEPEEISRFIEDNPKVVAISTHHGRLPVPTFAGGSVVPLMMLRHPLDRVGSVYSFERRQGQGSRGADFAGRHTFAEYVRWRLDLARNGVINNFHGMFLLNSATDRRAVIPQEFSEAQARLEALDFFGIVEQFADSIDLLGHVMRRDYPAFQTSHERRNISKERASTLEARLNDIRSSLGEALWDELCERNRFDLDLYDAAVKLFARRLAELPEVERRAG